jgi:toxin ParE1/3/4
MRIQYTSAAQEDLGHLLDYILEKNPANARLVLDRIECHIKLLATQPEMGRPGRVPETRELVIPKTPFIVPYQVRGDSLVILRVYHAAQKWPETL